ncbi:hypothetical protein MRX96_004299 [Rhipicephalus microplus]
MALPQPGPSDKHGAVPEPYPDMPPKSVSSLARDVGVLNTMADEVNRASVLEKGAPRPSYQQPPPLPMLRQPDHSQLMQDAWDMQRQLPKRRLPPSGGTAEVHNKSRLVSEFVEKLAAEIASKRISREEARSQLKDVVELENELAETLVSATNVKPDLTEEKLAAIAKMYQDISHSVITNPEMNRDDALSKLKNVAAMENELTQALVSDEEIANRPFRVTTAEESAFKLQQMKIKFADELQKSMAVSQPDASKIQDSIRQLYELEVLLMDKLFKAKNGKGRRRDKDKGRELATVREPKKKSKKPSTVVEISFSDSEESGATPVVCVVDGRQMDRQGEGWQLLSCPRESQKVIAREKREQAMSRPRGSAG